MSARTVHAPERKRAGDAEGLLEVRGSIDIGQFWPRGDSDADTTKIVVRVGPESFRFRPHPGAAFRVTRAFEGAVVAGRVRVPAIREGGRVVVRLQGIDAPELHYRPGACVPGARRSARQTELYLRWNHDYRQPLAETGTAALGAYLGAAAGRSVTCVVRTRVDDPAEVFDTYGRMVGDILVRRPRLVDLNHWLVERGWAVPAFYSSMLAGEISELLELTERARRGARGVWARIAERLGRFEWSRIYRGAEAPLVAEEDNARVLLPKLFRRHATWKVNRRAEMLKGSFGEYLERRPDGCYETAAFLDQGVTAAPHRRLDDYVRADGRVVAGPEALVFQEAPSEVTGPRGGELRW